MIGAKSCVPFLAAALLVSAGCSQDDPVKARKGADDPWPDMTEKDDAIETLLLCYDNPGLSVAMAKYEALLHSQYYFRLREDDVKPGDDPLMTRVEDIASTEWIFVNQTELLLWIPEAGFWEERSDIDGDPCENCWDTTRQYYIRARFPQFEGSIYQSPPERAFVTIVVAPDENDPSKWVIRAMYDIIIN